MKNSLTNSIDMKKKILGLCFCLLGLGASTLFAQQSMTAAGGNASGTGGSVTYSIGQVFYTSPSGATHNLIQGVQQPYEISVLSADEIKAEFVDLAASVYPNPTIDNFTLKVELNKLNNASFELYTSGGKLVTSAKIVNEETQLITSEFSASYYILNVYDGTQVIKTFKITRLY